MTPPGKPQHSIPQRDSLTVHTGSRLHFGLWAWGDAHARQFGGVGMMIDQPAVVVQLSPASRFEVAGPSAERLQQVAERCCQAWQLAELPACRLETIDLPPQHTGLGVGTQLSLAAGRGLAEWIQMPSQSAEALAQSTGRGVRSAVGSHGFALGGLIVDQGKQSGERLGALAQRVAVPESWRVVLITARRGKGLAGQSEQAAFTQLPEIAPQTTARLQQIGLEQLAPAAVAGDFKQFSEAVYAYGHQAGLCFASLQGRAYSTKAASELIDQLRQLGIAGVGQSSWGPTLFAFAPDAQAAERLSGWLQGNLDRAEYDVLITAPRNCGASISCE